MREIDHNQDQTAQIRAAVNRMLEDIEDEKELEEICRLIQVFFYSK